MFDFNGFKNEEFVVYCDTKRKAAAFVDLCKKEGLVQSNSQEGRLRKVVSEDDNIVFHYNPKATKYNLHHAYIKTYAGRFVIKRAMFDEKDIVLGDNMLV